MSFSNSDSLARSLVEKFQQKIDETMQSVLGGAERVACVDFPQSSNVGDNAIWLGQHAVLRRLRKQVVYQCDNRSYSKDQLKRQIGDGQLCICGSLLEFLE